MTLRRTVVFALSAVLLGSVAEGGVQGAAANSPGILMGGYTDPGDSRLANYLDRRSREKEVYGTNPDGSPRNHYDFALIFWQWPNPIPNQDFLETVKDGVIPYVFFNARYSNLTLREIADGAGDARIIEVSRYLQSVVADGQEVWFSWYDEPEVALRRWNIGDDSFVEWNGMTSGDYVASWRRVRFLFERHAPGVKFGYASLNSDWEFAFFPAAGQLDRVDFVASSQFAWSCPPENTFLREVLQARTKMAKLAPAVPHVINAVAAGKGACGSSARWIWDSIPVARALGGDPVNPLIAYGYWDDGSMSLGTKRGSVEAWRGAVLTLGAASG